LTESTGTSAVTPLSPGTQRSVGKLEVAYDDGVLSVTGKGGIIAQETNAHFVWSLRVYYRFDATKNAVYSHLYSEKVLDLTGAVPWTKPAVKPSVVMFPTFADAIPLDLPAGHYAVELGLHSCDKDGAGPKLPVAGSNPRGAAARQELVIN
jgi:hypothetical protein